jgi:integrase
MTDRNPTSPANPNKPSRPSKPRPDFPLFPHAAGVWAKKIRGKLYYFGPWSDPEGALKNYEAQAEDLHAGRTPRPDPKAVTVKDCCNDFIDAKEAQVANGELSPRTLANYNRACVALLAQAGKGRLMADLGPDDFAALRGKLAGSNGPHRLCLMIQCVRCICKHAWDARLIDRPVHYGASFKRPSMKTLRLHRAKQGPKLFTAEEVRRLVGAAGVQVKAMLLLGINAGFGNADCGRLPLSALDLDAGWANYPRPKTGIDRRCPLWPETVAALREALAQRPEPKDPADAGLAFVTRWGDCWTKDTDNCAITKETAKLLKALSINGRKGLGFYTLRHTFRTVADEAKDQPAADFIMGHEVPHMSSVYRETISDARLKAVADHVRTWLFPPVKEAKDWAGPKEAGPARAADAPEKP